MFVKGEVGMEKLFRTDNTEGYSQAKLDALNKEWGEKSKGIDPNSEEYHAAAKAFADEVASR